jgi:trehalose 6-phosphate synthase/phosphatase
MKRMSSNNRLVIVSNRLPVTARATDEGVQLAPSGGGLATGLPRFHDGTAGLWFGWPGDVSQVTAEQRADLDSQLLARRMVAVRLSQDQVERYYHGFANRVLWPLFHYLIDRVPVEAAGWDAYREVNEVFADAVACEYRAGDTIWVHDYQLMLVPGLLRQRLPSARIGFFLHIPFPSSEVVRVLPWRREILTGLLGADLVGFHTFAYMRHFLASLLHVAGVEPEIDRVRLEGRDVKLGVFPMGVDAKHFDAAARDPQVIARAQAIRSESDGRQIVLGIDRLDYTKGIPCRLEAVERLLRNDPSLRDRIRYIQVAVPSRGEVDSYQRFKRQVEESVGRINGACSTVQSTPVHYMHGSVSPVELVALYRAADVMLVTPLRDGMNLVAKEFVASRPDGDGVLLLSEFAGAAAELDGAVVVNPYDVDGVARSLEHALKMSASERTARMKRLRRRVFDHDLHAWGQVFLTELETVRRPDTSRALNSSERSLPTALTTAAAAPELRVLLDYDGTLVPLARSPELAAPDDEILSLLEALASAPRIRIDLVSGRPHHTLEEWFGELPLSLWAEHGFWYRPRGMRDWHSSSLVIPDWVTRIRPILEQFTAHTPGSHVETKSASIAWHYRRAERDFGARQAHELRMLLGDALSNQPFEVLEGKKVIEVRLRGVSKALVAERVRTEMRSDAQLIAIGDDRTDDELFRALPLSSVTIAVGTGPSDARFRVADYRAVRQILRGLISEPEASELLKTAQRYNPAVAQSSDLIPETQR